MPRKPDRLQKAFAAMRGETDRATSGGRKSGGDKPPADETRRRGDARKARRTDAERPPRREEPRAEPRRDPARKPEPRKTVAPRPPAAPDRDRFDLVAVCPPGLEAVAAAEMRELGLAVRAFEPNGGTVEWSGALREVMRANLHLRTVERITLGLGAFRATHFAQLRDKAARLPWSHWLRPERPICLRVSADSSKLYHQGAIAERLAGALGDHFGAPPRIVKGGDEAGDDGAQLIVARMHKDACTLRLDTSGARLHQRGYRLQTAKAPLRETLAAALLRLSGWPDDAPFCDPFCGSGTFAIEAALRATRRAPGLARSFAFEHFVFFDPALWRSLLDEARALIRPAPAPILGSDRDAGAVEAARANAERAGVAEAVRFEVRAVSDAAAPAGAAPGWIVTNPPYGLRVQSGGDLRNLYARFAQVARARFPGWRALFLCAHPAHAHAAGADFSAGPWYNNGGVRVKALRLEPAAPASTSP